MIQCVRKQTYEASAEVAIIYLIVKVCFFSLKLTYSSLVIEILLSCKFLSIAPKYGLCLKKYAIRLTREGVALLTTTQHFTNFSDDR